MGSIVITLYPPGEGDSSERSTEETGDKVSFNDQNTDIALPCVTGSWQVHASLKVNDQEPPLYNNSVYEPIDCSADEEEEEEEG